MFFSTIAAYITAVVVPALLDMFWIGFLMKKTYEKGLAHLIAPAFNVYAAIAFYLLYAIGVMFFVVLPNYEKGLLQGALVGALFGLVAYGVYDLTNLVTLKNWPLYLTIIDMVWGAFITSCASVLAAVVLRFFFR